MPESPSDADVTRLSTLVEELFEKARGARSRRSAHTVFGGADRLLRQTVLVLLDGTELAEHDAPPEATLQVLRGSVELRSASHTWTLAAGDVAPIPRERHSVAAREDAAFLLTTRRAATTDTDPSEAVHRDGTA